MRLANKDAVRVAILSAATLISGCSAYTSKPTTTLLPSSNRSIDIVLHRSDVRVMDCSTLAIIQTYNSTGTLIDSKEARGSALHCVLLPAAIEAGGRVGAAAAVRPAITTIKNAVSNTNGQSQLQWQNGSVVSTNSNTNSNANSNNNNNANANTATGGAGGNATGGNATGGTGSEGHGNNGGGNGTNDGTNPGNDNHHDNGDNS